MTAGAVAASGACGWNAGDHAAALDAFALSRDRRSPALSAHLPRDLGRMTFLRTRSA